MKLKKLSGLLSAVLAGAMVLSMAPAAFAAAKCEHINQTGVDNGDGTCSYVCNKCGDVVDTQAHVWDKDGICVRCNAKKPACDHSKQHAVDNGDGTCSYVCDVDGTVIDTAAHVYYKGETTCARCGHKCDHSTFKYENNGNGTHKVICKDCGAVVTDATECVYGEDGKGTCACGAKYTCDHMKNNWKYVNNGNSTHNVVCADCGAVVSANVACNYENGVCITCGAKQSECNHMGNHWTYVDNGNGTHKVICKDCGNVVEKHADCVYTEGKCVCGGHQKKVVIPDTDDLDPSFSVSRYPICQFFQAVRQFFRSLFHRA